MNKLAFVLHNCFQSGELVTNLQYIVGDSDKTLTYRLPRVYRGLFIPRTKYEAKSTNVASMRLYEP